jgi:hypothetical protein
MRLHHAARTATTRHLPDGFDLTLNPQVLGSNPRGRTRLTRSTALFVGGRDVPREGHPRNFAIQPRNGAKIRARFRPWVPHRPVHTPRPKAKGRTIQFIDEHGTPGIFDCQTIQRGVWSNDVGYLRERSLRELLSHYGDELARHGVAPPSPAEMWDCYRRSIIYPFYLWSMTRPIVQPIEAITTFVTRIGRAVEHTQSYEALGV